MKGQAMNITIGALLQIDIPTREDQVTTTIIGQVTGVAESFSNPDFPRVIIAGMDAWIDLEGKTWVIR